MLSLSFFLSLLGIILLSSSRVFLALSQCFFSFSFLLFPTCVLLVTKKMTPPCAFFSPFLFALFLFLFLFIFIFWNQGGSEKLPLFDHSKFLLSRERELFWTVSQFSLLLLLFFLRKYYVELGEWEVRELTISLLFYLLLFYLFIF